MIYNLVEFLKHIFSPELVVVTLAAAPVSELRGAIPLALGSFNFSVQKAVTLSILGNLIPVIPLFFMLNYISEFLMKFKWGNKFFTWWFNRTRKHSDLVEKYETLGLILFVGIPLPMTGAWSGCVAAYLLGIKFRHAFPAIITGILLAATIVTLATTGFINIFK